MNREPTVEDFERNEEKYIAEQAKIFKEYVENNEPFCSLRERILNMKVSDFDDDGRAYIHFHCEFESDDYDLIKNNKGNTRLKELTNIDDLIGDVFLARAFNVENFAIIYHHPDMDQSKIIITQNEPVTAPKLTRGERVTQCFKNLCMRSK